MVARHVFKILDLLLFLYIFLIYGKTCINLTSINNKLSLIKVLDTISLNYCKIDLYLRGHPY